MILNMEEQKRQVLVEHVRQYIATTDPAEMKMQDIAEFCGVAKGTLYNYFNSKEDLLLAVIQDALKPYDREVEDLVDKKSVNADVKVKEIIRIQLRFFQDNRNLMILFAREVNKIFSTLSRAETTREKFLAEHTEWFLGLCSDLLGDLFPKDSTRVLAYMWHETMRSYLTYCLYENRNVDLALDTERLYSYFIHGARAYVATSELE